MPIAEPRRDDVMTDYGTLNRLYPQTVTYKVDNKNYILMEDENGEFLIKEISQKGKLDKDISSGQFSRYFDIIQVAYDDKNKNTYICAISLGGKKMKLFQANNLGIDKKYSKDYVINGRKSFNFFFIDGLLHLLNAMKTTKAAIVFIQFLFNKNQYYFSIKNIKISCNYGRL